MREALFLVLAATLEVGGDALIRWGLKTDRDLRILLGGVVLLGYGILVNLPKWPFSRLMGVYIAVFFVVSQIVSVLFFRERLGPPALWGGALIVGGGLVLTFGRATG